MGWIALLLAVFAIFIIISAAVLPRLFLRDRCSLARTRDRGIKKYSDGDGESCLYEPVSFVRRHIKQYVISYRDGQKSLVCKLARRIEYIDFDVVAFTDEGAICGILNVKEQIKDGLYTSVIELPIAAAYVTLNVNSVDDRMFENKIITRVSWVKILLFSLLTTALIGLGTIAMTIACAHFMGGMFDESLLYDGGSRLVILIICASVMAVNFLLNVIFLSVRNNRSAGKRKGVEQ